MVETGGVHVNSERFDISSSIIAVRVDETQDLKGLTVLGMVGFRHLVLVCSFLSEFCLPCISWKLGVSLLMFWNIWHVCLLMWLQDLVLVCLVFAGIFPVTSELQALPFVGFVFPGYIGNFLITSRLKALVCLPWLLVALPVSLFNSLGCFHFFPPKQTCISFLTNQWGQNRVKEAGLLDLDDSTWQFIDRISIVLHA